MDAIFMNSKNSKTSDPRSSQTQKINLKKVINMLSICYTSKNIKKSYEDNKFKISAPTWNEDFELPDGSYSVSNIQDYIKYNIRNYKEVTDNLPIRSICKSNRKEEYIQNKNA